MKSQTPPDGENKKTDAAAASAAPAAQEQTDRKASAPLRTAISEHPVTPPPAGSPTRHPDQTGLRIGDMIGSYRLEERIGAGGAAFVWRAVHTQLHVERAIKVLNPLELEKHPRMGARFLHEARLASLISHPNLISVHDYGRDETRGLCYLVMDYLPNGSLADRLSKELTLSEAEAIRIVRQVADALNHGGSRKMIHRDIKPDNILFGPNGEAKLVDLGIAKADWDEEAPLTLNNELMGTPPYMAPEQIADSGQVDTRADIYSLGVVFYEMLSSRRPYPGRTLNEVVAALRRNPSPPDLRTLRPEISQGTAKLIGEMMDRDPKRRIQTMDALLTELSQLEAVATATADNTSAVHLHTPPSPGTASKTTRTGIPSAVTATAATEESAGATGGIVAALILLGLVLVLSLFFISHMLQTKKGAAGSIAVSSVAAGEALHRTAPADNPTDAAPADNPTDAAPAASGTSEAPPGTPQPPQKTDSADIPAAPQPQEIAPPMPAASAPAAPRELETEISLWLGANPVTSATVVIFPENGAPVRMTEAPYVLTLQEGTRFGLRIEGGRQGELRWKPAEANGLTAASHVAFRELRPATTVTRRLRGFEVLAGGEPVTEVRGVLLQYGAPQPFGPCTPAELAAFLRRNAALDGNFAVRFTDAGGNVLALFDFGAARPEKGDATPLLSGVRLDLSEGTLTLYETVEE